MKKRWKQDATRKIDNTDEGTDKEKQQAIGGEVNKRAKETPQNTSTIIA